MSEEVEEVSEFSRAVWDEVAQRLSRTGFSGLVFRVVSGPNMPFAVEAGGAVQSARAVVNPDFREKLTKTVRDVIVSRSPGSLCVLSRGPSWPAFTIGLSQEIELMEDYAPMIHRPYIPEGLSQRDTPEPPEPPELEELVKVTNDPPPVFLPDPGAPSRLETAPEMRGELTPLPPTPSSFACVHEPSEGSLRRIARELGDLVVEKNRAYGNSVATSAVAMALLYPEGVRPDQLRDMLTLVRIWDKMKRIATKKDAFGESPFRDIVGYALLGAENDEADK
jgi:hypothetical protein